jgi:cytochrome c biogenesis protein CcmG/thiol:disulfide interchange protein DsbE
MTSNGNRRRRDYGRWLMVLVLFALAGLLGVRNWRAERAFELGTAGRIVGSPAPDVPFTTLNGGHMQLAALRGRPVWLNFFATWCGPCRTEMPQIERRYRSFAGRGLVVLGVDQQETPPQVEGFAKRLGLTFPLVIDEGPAAARFGVFALPTSVFVDARGIVRAVKTGQMRPADMDADLALIIR